MHEIVRSRESTKYTPQLASSKHKSEGTVVYTGSASAQSGFAKIV